MNRKQYAMEHKHLSQSKDRTAVRNAEAKRQKELAIFKANKFRDCTLAEVMGAITSNLVETQYFYGSSIWYTESQNTIQWEKQSYDIAIKAVNKAIVEYGKNKALLTGTSVENIKLLAVKYAKNEYISRFSPLAKAIK